MNENELPNELISSRVRTNEFLRQKNRFLGVSRRQAIQLLAVGAGATATLALSAFDQGKATIAARAKQGNKQVSNRLEPNLFKLQGHNTRIVYSTSSIAGLPLLSYSSRELKRDFTRISHEPPRTNQFNWLSIRFSLF